MAQRKGHRDLPRKDDASLNEVERQAFDEEKGNLAGVEGRIDKAVDELDGRIMRAESNMDYVPVDIEGRTYRADEMRDLRVLKERRKEYVGYKSSPYFGHIDIMGEDGSPIVIFVGEKGLSAGGDTIIVDWRSDMGETYYNKQSRDFTVGGRKYSLLLRRALSINGGKLLAVHTEYDSSLSEFKGDVVDPFLVSVLRDKRRDYKLTDIIKTIQQNQNEIMRLPLHENFIVQGCAGSGKTMILLHRLSYLAYNYKGSIDFSRFAILTPSDFFNEHVDELGDQLGLSMIGRYTTEGYYARLIRRMSSSDYVAEEGGGEKRKVVVPDTVVLSEDYLGSEILGTVYSNRFVDDIEADIRSALSRVLDLAAESGLFRLFESYSLDVPTCDGTAYAAYVALDRGTRRIRKRSADAHRDIAEAQKAFDRAALRLEEAMERKCALDQSFADCRRNVVEAAHDEIEALRQHAASLEEEKSRYLATVSSLEGKLAFSESEKTRIYGEINRIKEAASRADSPRDLLNEMASFGNHLREACSESLSVAAESEKRLAGFEIVHVLKSKMERADLGGKQSWIMRRAIDLSAVASERASMEEERARVELDRASAQSVSAQLARRDAEVQLEGESSSFNLLMHYVHEVGEAQEGLDTIDYLTSSSNSAAVKLRSLLASELAGLRSMNEELMGLGVFSFRKKKALAERISDSERHVLALARGKLEELQSESASDLEAARVSLGAAQEMAIGAAHAVELAEKLVNRAKEQYEQAKGRTRRIASIAVASATFDDAVPSIKAIAELFEDNSLRLGIEEVAAMEAGCREAALARETAIVRARNLMAGAESSLDARVSEEVASLLETLHFQLPDERTLDSMAQEIDRLNAGVKEASSSIAGIQDAEKRIIEVLDAVEGEPCPSLAELLPEGSGSSLSNAVASYESLRSSLDPETLEVYSDSAKRVEVLESLFRDKEKKLRSAEERLVTDQDEALLIEARAWLEDLDIRRFLESGDKRLSTLYGKYGYVPSEDLFYRHQLFSLLAICAVYYGSRGLRDEYLSIDEAQDISPAEYSVLRRALGPDVVFNLYGDLSQGICEYRGVSDWSQIAESVTSKVFRLNQNYRNTLQITEFCNERFGMATMGVGVKGAKVKELHIQDAIQEIFALRANEDSLRLAMIHKRGLVGFREYFGGFLGKDASWGEVDLSKLSVIDVESSKGLEFDAAIVVVNRMDKKEQYIAFTRALDNLFVCNIHGLNKVSAPSPVLASAAESGLLEERAGDGAPLMGDVFSQGDLLEQGAEREGQEVADPFDSIFEGMDDFELEVPDAED